MELEQIVNSISGFADWTYTDKIKLFAWYLHTHRGQAHFQTADVTNCFESLHIAHPGLSPFILALTKKRPPELLKSKQGYRLENRVRSPFDQQYGERQATIYVDKLLSELPTKIQIPAEKGYLDEALVCFRHKAFRAAVVMCWNLAFDHLCEYVMKDAQRLSDFNVQLPKSCPKADISAIAKRDHFAVLKESQVLQVLKSANIISNSVFKILTQKLDRRNIAAHPSGAVTSQVTAEEFIKDLIENVVLQIN